MSDSLSSGQTSSEAVHERERFEKWWRPLERDMLVSGEARKIAALKFMADLAWCAALEEAARAIVIAHEALFREPEQGVSYGYEPTLADYLNAIRSLIPEPMPTESGNPADARSTLGLIHQRTKP